MAVLGAAAEVGNLQRIVVRSGLEVYGRARHSPSVPDESVVPHPTSAFGRSLLEVERLAAATGRTVGVPVGVLRLASVVGPRFPSPLGRFLRLPVVPFSALADPTFSVLHVEDAAAGLVAALFGDVNEPVNVLGPGAVTISQAARLGRRLPLPLLGPEWLVVRRLSGLIRTPLPGHLLELIHRGRTAEAHACVDLLGWAPTRTTREVIEDLYEWRDPIALQLVEAEEAA
jgi:UDP-glucose 4-epimerase